MGRFFDAVASLTGIRQVINYEAQAAIEFEAIADPSITGEYELSLEPIVGSSNPRYQINPYPLIEELVSDVQSGIAASAISARFHNTIARIIAQTCRKLRDDYEVNDVALSGGVWQNLTLLTRTFNTLQKDNFNVFIHKKVPTNDGGLSLGQAVVAVERMLN
jgi:hydrogenase maturation protein HypF